MNVVSVIQVLKLYRHRNDKMKNVFLLQGRLLANNAFLSEGIAWSWKTSVFKQFVADQLS